MNTIQETTEQAPLFGEWLREPVKGTPLRTTAIASHLMAITILGAALASGEPLKVMPSYTVENSFYRLTIDAGRGGAIRSFRLKASDPNMEWIYPEGGGLLEDKIWQQGQPG